LCAAPPAALRRGSRGPLALPDGTPPRDAGSMFGRHSAQEVPRQGGQERLRFSDPSVPSRACCCPGRPAVRVMMPPANGRRHPVDLWLCRHHYNASCAALALAGATVEELAMPEEQPEAARAIAAT
jgi:hypothetical protein